METVSLADAFGRFLAEPVRSTVDLPPADNSAMDGYAVRAQDLASAAGKTPVALRLIGAAPAGVVFDETVEQGTCVRVFTGSVLPRGADAVVMQEDVQCDQRDHVPNPVYLKRSRRGKIAACAAKTSNPARSSPPRARN